MNKVTKNYTIIISISTIVVTLIIVIYFLSSNKNRNSLEIKLPPDALSEILIGKIDNSNTMKSKLDESPIQKLTNIPENFTDHIINSDKYITKNITISKDDKGINVDKADRDLFYFFHNYKWKNGDGWFIKDILSRRYYVPEGLMKIKEGTEFEWLPYTGEDSIEIVLIYKKE